PANRGLLMRTLSRRSWGALQNEVTEKHSFAALRVIGRVLRVYDCGTENADSCRPKGFTERDPSRKFLVVKSENEPPGGCQESAPLGETGSDPILVVLRRRPTSAVRYGFRSFIGKREALRLMQPDVKQAR